MCGFESFKERQAGALEDVQLMNQCKQKNVKRNNVTSVELLPSDRPEEITMIELKRFECYDVPDIDQCEREGINEDNLFDNDLIELKLDDAVTIRPICGATVKMILPSGFVYDDTALSKHYFLAKNPEFGADSFTIERQIAEITIDEKCNFTHPDTVAINLFEKDDSTTVNYYIIVTIFNPDKETSIKLLKGEKVAVARSEISKVAGNPEFENYSTIKSKILDKEKAEREKRILDEKKAKRKKKKKKGGKKDKGGKKKKAKKSKEISAAEKAKLSFDIDNDELDYEAEDKQEDDDNEDNHENNDVDDDSDFYMSDIEPERLRGYHDETEEGIGATTTSVSALNPTSSNDVSLSDDDDIMILEEVQQNNDNNEKDDGKDGTENNDKEKASEDKSLESPDEGYKEKDDRSKEGEKNKNKRKERKESENQGRDNENSSNLNGNGTPTSHNGSDTPTRDEQPDEVIEIDLSSDENEVDNDVDMDEIFMPITPKQSQPREVIVTTPPPGEAEVIIPPSPIKPKARENTIGVLITSSEPPPPGMEEEMDFEMDLDPSTPTGESEAEEEFIVNGVTAQSNQNLISIPTAFPVISIPTVPKVILNSQPNIQTELRREDYTEMNTKVDKVPSGLSGIRKTKSTEKKPVGPSLPIPEKEKLMKLTVKVLKGYLVKHDLITSGLKADLTKRLIEFFTDNPDKIDPALVTDKEEVTKDTAKVDEPNKTLVTPQQENKSGKEELENFESDKSSYPHLFKPESRVTADTIADMYEDLQNLHQPGSNEPTPPGLTPENRQKKSSSPALTPQLSIPTIKPLGRSIPVIGQSSDHGDLENFDQSKNNLNPHLFGPTVLPQHRRNEPIMNPANIIQDKFNPNLSVIVPSSSSSNMAFTNNPPPLLNPMVGAPPIKEESDSKVSQKQAEIKALATIETVFHDRIHFVELKEKLSLEQVGKNVIDFHLAPLDLFISDLADRKVQLKKLETKSFKIPKQICKIKLQGRNVHAEILVDTFTKKFIEPCQVFLKVHIEKIEIDKIEDPFKIPLPHVIDEGEIF